jgi:ribosome-associated protein
VSSRVTVFFDVARSPTLSEQQRRRILAKLATRINKEGVIRIVSQRTRSQEMNREDAVLRFSDLLRDALTVRPTRIETRPPQAASQRRLEEKKKRTEVKRERSRKEWD